MPPPIETPVPATRRAERGNRFSRDTLVAGCHFGIALSAYLAFLTTHFSFDAVAGGVVLYYWLITGDIVRLIHPYHTLYFPVAAAVEGGLRSAGLELDPLTVLQLLSAPFAAASVALYYRLARACVLGEVLSATLAALFGGGFAFWYYATDGESHPIALFFLLLAFLSMLRARARPSWARILLPGAWLGLAVGFHGSCLLSLPGLVALAWPRERVRGAWRLAVTTIVATGLLWVLPQTVRLLGRPTAPLAGVSTAAAVFAGEEGWSIKPRILDQWTGLADSMAPADWPALPPGHPTLAAVVRLGLLALTLLPLALLFGIERSRRRIVLSLALWLLAGFGFFSTYFAGSPKFTSYQWAPLLLLAGVTIEGLARSRPLELLARTALAALAVATVFCSLDLVRRQVDGSTNPHLVRARAIGRLTEPGDVIVHLGRGEYRYLEVYLPYFAARQAIALEPYFDRARADPRQATRAVGARLGAATAAGSGRLVALADVIEPGAPAREFEREKRLPEGSLAALFAGYHPRPMSSDPAIGTLWLLGPPLPNESAAVPAAASR